MKSLAQHIQESLNDREEQTSPSILDVAITRTEETEEE